MREGREQKEGQHGIRKWGREKESEIAERETESQSKPPFPPSQQPAIFGDLRSES